MKKACHLIHYGISFMVLLLIPAFIHTQNVGIGTTSPLARLHVADSNVVFSGSSILGWPGAPPIQGPGRRMMWYADKVAFRAGMVDGDNWNKDSIGVFSAAFGYNTLAIGEYSFATGYHTESRGNSSVSMGTFSKALSHYTIALGVGSKASGYASTAIGGGQASGEFSTAIGGGLTYAKSAYETSLGHYNTDYAPVSTTDWITTDRLFGVGNGTSFFERSDALVILKNGNTGIGYSSPNATLEVARGNGVFGTAVFHGTSYTSYFNFGSDEDTYIRAGKDNRSVVLNDIPGGKVGIGTSYPNAPLGFPAWLGKKITLYPGATGDVGFAVEGNQLLIYSDHPGASVRLGYDQAGVFQYNLDVYGNGNALLRGSLTQNSDLRLKKDIIPLQHSLEKIIHLNGYHYYWKDEKSDSTLQTGVIAQEVQQLFPEMVKEDEQGMLSVNYSALIPLLIESTKELNQKIYEMNKQIENVLLVLEQCQGKN